MILSSIKKTKNLPTLSIISRLRNGDYLNKKIQRQQKEHQSIFDRKQQLKINRGNDETLQKINEKSENWTNNDHEMMIALNDDHLTLQKIKQLIESDQHCHQTVKAKAMQKCRKFAIPGYYVAKNIFETIDNPSTITVGMMLDLMIKNVQKSDFIEFVSNYKIDYNAFVVVGIILKGICEFEIKDTNRYKFIADFIAAIEENDIVFKKTDKILCGDFIRYCGMTNQTHKAQLLFEKYCQTFPNNVTLQLSSILDFAIFKFVI